MTLKWRAALLFGGQLILVTGGVIVLLVLQHDQRAAVARADTAQRVQVLQAEYFVGMVEAESGLQEYLDTGDATNLTNYHEGLDEVAAVSAKLRLIKTDAAGLRYQQQVFAQAEAWQGYSIRALSPVLFQAPTQNFGDDLFDSYAAAQLRSTAYLETVVAKGSAEEAAGTSREILALAAIGAIAVVTVVAGGPSSTARRCCPWAV